MSGRGLLGLVEATLVEANGRERVDELLGEASASTLDEVAERRRENALAALMVGGEVG